MSPKWSSIALLCVIFCVTGCGKKVDLEKMNGYLETVIKDKDQQIVELKNENKDLAKQLKAEKIAREAAEEETRKKERAFQQTEATWGGKANELAREYQGKVLLVDQKEAANKLRQAELEAQARELKRQQEILKEQQETLNKKGRRF